MTNAQKLNIAKFLSRGNLIDTRPKYRYVGVFRGKDLRKIVREKEL